MIVSVHSLVPLCMVVLVVSAHEREQPFQGGEQHVHHMEQPHQRGEQHVEQQPPVPLRTEHDPGLPVEEFHEEQRHEDARAYHDHIHSHDKEHLREHLDGMVNPDEDLSDDEANFRFFKVHDYDNNNLLDGIELMSALTDYHHHDEGAADKEEFTDSRLEQLIDGLLGDADQNGDGYIDYFEYISMQKL